MSEYVLKINKGNKNIQKMILLNHLLFMMKIFLIK